MSPITHGIIGWLIAQPLAARKDRVLVTAAALVSDLDGLSLLLGQEAYGTFHHTFGHNLLFGILSSIIVALLSQQKYLAAGLGFLSFHSHLICDLFGSGEGWPIPYLWPSSRLTFVLPGSYGWELDSWQNLIITGIALIFVYWIALKKNRTIVEVVSVAADQTVVSILKKWSRLYKR
ncbi:MAG: hypothetical protein EOP11_11230 [Proteobacteria bacterium]|nr:MAG: hypothetical protein EOP11_11230 [Pseudomonadota bacterium]